jgi:hypothetical protein
MLATGQIEPGCEVRIDLRPDREGLKFEIW